MRSDNEPLRLPRLAKPIRAAVLIVALVAMGTALGLGYATPPPDAASIPTAAISVSAADLNREVSFADLSRSATNGLLYEDETPFTGIALTRLDEGYRRSAYVAGRRDGVTQQWYPDGTLSYRATYVAGRRDGTAETWWPDGTLRSQSRYVLGKAEGVQREWYRSGAPFKELHIVGGVESGSQRAWRENGKLYVNYEARDGRIFGLKRANLCFDLDDEEVALD